MLCMIDNKSENHWFNYKKYIYLKWNIEELKELKFEGSICKYEKEDAKGRVELENK